MLRHRFVGDDGGTFPEADKREPWMRLLFRATHQLSSDLISLSPSVQRDLLPRPYFFVFSHIAYIALALSASIRREPVGHNDASHIRGSGSTVSAPKFGDDVSRLILDAHIQQLFTLYTLALFYSYFSRYFPTTTPGARGTHDSVHRG